MEMGREVAIALPMMQVVALRMIMKAAGLEVDANTGRISTRMTPWVRIQDL